MHFNPNGHSKYKLTLIHGFVKKYHTDSDNRLVLSAKKQQNFQSDYFKSPYVKEINNDNFLMEYIDGDFFIENVKFNSKILIEKLKGYFLENIIGEVEVPIDIFINKLISLKTEKKYLDLFKKKDTIKIYDGKCHGDMTLSNMIFADDIYLIDFLDSYVESPTMDLIKLRQDTHLHWSFNMISETKNLTKIKTELEYIDNWITDTFNIEEYNLLQIINLLRIYPYCKTQKIKNWLDKNIEELYQSI